MIRKAIDEIEVEIAQEIREVVLDDAYHSQGGVVEGLNRWRHSLPWDHVVLQESKHVHDQLLDLEPLLVESVVYSRRALASGRLKAWDVYELL